MREGDGDVHERDKTSGDRAGRDAGDGGETTRVRDGVSDAHTHTEVVEDNGEKLAERVETRCEQLGSLPRE